MKVILLSVLLLFLGITLFGQKNQCNIQTSLTGNKVVQLITISSKLGDVTLGKTENEYYLGYISKGFYNLVRGGMANLQIDSIGVRFTNSDTHYYKAEGTGIAPEMIKSPKFWGTYLSVKLTESEWKFIRAQRIVAFYVFGEKNSNGRVSLKKQQGKQLKKAFVCF
jgi:hypothetical protein